VPQDVILAVSCQRQIKVSAKPSTAGRKSVVFQAQFDDDKSDYANAARDQRKQGHAQVDNTPHEPVCVLFFFASAFDAYSATSNNPVGLPSFCLYTNLRAVPDAFCERIRRIESGK
jgi:hypothetical protein